MMNWMRDLVVAGALAVAAGALGAMEVRAQTPAGQAGYRRVGDYVIGGAHHIRGLPGSGSAENPTLETCQAVCSGREDCKGFARRKPQRVASWCQYYAVSWREAQADGSLVPHRAFDYYEKVGTEAPATDTGGGSEVAATTAGEDAILGRWRRKGDETVLELSRQGPTIVGHLRVLGAGMADFGFREGEETVRLTAVDGNRYSGQVRWRFRSGAQEWRNAVFVVSGDVMTNGEEWVRVGGTGPTTGEAGRVIEADRKQVRPGELVQVYVRLRNPDGVANMNYELRYDPAVARPEGRPVAGNLLRGSALFQANPGERGLIRIGFAGAEGLNRDGSVAVIPFRAVGQAGARTTLTLRTPITEDSQGRTLPIARVDGAIVIARGAGGDGAGGDGAGGGDGTGGGRLPDCNGDGRINTFDADCALQVSVGLRPASLAEASPATLLVLDADGNRQVTSGDARLIQQRVRDGVYRR